MELIRPVPDAPGYYADFYGDIWSCRRRTWARLSARVNNKGCLYLAAKRTGRKLTSERVHRLVCAAYHGGWPDQKMEVRHLNGDRLDNRASNLTWGTRSENAFDRNRHGTGSRGEGNPRAKITEAQAIEILKMSPKPKGAEVRAIADRLGVDPDSIYRILNGQRWGYLRPLVGEK